MLIEAEALDAATTAAGRRPDGFPRCRIPDSVHGVIAARIDLLDADARDALRRCSVVGRVFWPAAVGIDEAIALTLDRRGLVSEPPQSSMAGLQEFAFKHALTRDVAYASLPRTERRELHRQVAEWIQHVAPDRGGRGGRARRVSLRGGDRLRRGRSRGLETRLRAAAAGGRGCAARGALSVAGAQLGRALELAPDDGTRAAAQFALALVDASSGSGTLEVPAAGARPAREGARARRRGRGDLARGRARLALAHPVVAR